MSRTRTTRAPSLLGLALAIASLGSFAPAGGAEWVEVRSPYFRVISDASARRAQRVAGEFEEVRRAIELWFPALEHDPGEITIFALTNTEGMKSFTTYRRDGIAGFFRPNQLGGDIALSLQVDTQQAFGVLYHEYFHSVTRHSLPGLPLWLNEGLAEIWANSTIDGRKIQIGLINRGHMRYLGYTKLMPFDVLLDPDQASEVYTDRERRGNFYSQSWALTHYFMMGDGGERWPKLLAYLEAQVHGVPEEEAWNTQFGSRKAVTKDLWKYLNGRRFSSRILETSVAVDGATFPTRPLTEAEVKAYRGDYLSRGGDRSIAGKELSDAVDADIPAELKAMAYEALGFLSLRATLYEPARKNFDKALELDDTRHRTHFFLAELESRERSEGWVDRAERSLLESTRHASWFGLGHERLAAHYAAIDSTPARALAVARRAVRHSRGSAQAHLQVAWLLRRDDPQSAEAGESARFARHLATSSAGPSVANNVCWYGTLYGLVEEVYPACETAVRRSPESVAYLDSRGVARAAKGDLEGAVADFEAALRGEGLSEESARERRQWLDRLRMGENPIDDDTLRDLLSRSRLEG